MKTTKVSITGTALSGKTAFLTSLIWQLEVGNLDRIEPETLELVKGNTFDYNKTRNSLTQEGKWPLKTSDQHQFNCTIERKDRKNLFSRLLKHRRISSKHKLEFFDFPGERIADVAIALNPKFGEWCDEILKHFDSHKDYREATQPYVEFMATEAAENGKEGVDKELYPACIKLYKKTLTQLISSYKPYISPSTFLLDRDGTQIETQDEEVIARERHSGLNVESQFAPLSTDFRQQYPELTEAMAKHYKAYRKELVLPLFKKIAESDKLLFLIDIPMTLAGGVGRYNDTRQIVLNLCDILGQESNIAKRLFKLLFLKTKLRSVNFVTTKEDLILPKDIKSNRPYVLARELTWGAKQKLGLIPEYFTCSAFHSTRPGDALDTLTGKRISNNPSKKEIEFRISNLPEAWPPDWAAGEYKFEVVHPKVPSSHTSLPKNNGMNKIIQHIIK